MLHGSWNSSRSGGSLQAEVEELSRQANLVSKSIGQAKTDAEREARKDDGRRIRELKEEIQAHLERLAAEANVIHNAIPNLTHPEAPVGGADASKELRHGEVDVRPLGFPVLDHVQLAEQHNLIDFDGGARVAGHGFYFLKNEAALLELALQQFAMERLLREGFTPMVTPDLARGDVLKGIGFIPRGPETQIYSIENHDLNLVATAEITLGGLYAGEVIEAEKLPIKLCGISHCFRTEAARPAGPRAGCTACINSQRSKCSPSRCPSRAKTCTIISATWNAKSSTAWGFRTACWISPRATWAAPPIASSTWKPGCPAAALAANMARSPALRTAPITNPAGSTSATK